MTKQATLVIGATGNVGGHVAAQLATSGAPVRALVRDPDLARLPAGVEPVRGDLTTPDTLAAAARGAGSVFLMWPLRTADPAPEVARALAEHAHRVVLLSSGSVQDDYNGSLGAVGDLHAAVEAAIRESGPEWTFIRPHAFATNVLPWAESIRADGVVRGAYGEAEMNPIHERDMADVALAALTGPGHAGAAYEVTGPESLSQREQVRIIGAVTGRPARWEELSLDDARRELGTWLPAEFVDQYLTVLAERVGSTSPVTDTVQRVTGRPARTFREWVADHADAFR